MRRDATPGPSFAPTRAAARPVPYGAHARAALLLLAALLGDATATRAQTPADMDAPLPADANVVTGRLENGLRYYIRVNRRPEQRAELRLAVNAGSVLETDAQRGLAHFVEHMAFNGTKNFAKQELVAYLESIGMRFGADVNAYTGFDETVYALTVPTDTGTFLERGIQILEDWAHNQVFDPAEVQKERPVVIEEWRLGQGAGARMRDRFFPVLLQGSRYAERLPIGDRAVLETFDSAQARAFYDEWYRPEQMAVIAVGDFDAAAVERLIARHFGGIAARAPHERPVYPVPDHEETLVSIVTDAEATSSSVSVYHKLPVQRTRTLGDYRRSMLEQLYNGMLNARLSELAQRADPPFLGAGSSRGSLLRSKDAYVVGAGVAEGGIERGLEAVLVEAERVARHGFTASELERATSTMLRSYELAYAEREKTESASYAEEYVRSFLEGEAIPGIAAEYELARRFLPGITLAEVNALAGEWMSARNRVIVAQAPEKPGAPVPTAAALLAAFEAARARPVEPWVDDVASTALVRVPPEPGSITSEKALADVGAIEWTLSNGARVLLKPTRFKDDELLFAATSPGGTSLAPDELLLSASFSDEAVSVGGVGGLSLIQLRKALAGKAASVQPVLSELTEGLSGQASPQDAETMFQLIHLYFTEPRADEEAFRSVLASFKAQLANRAAAPETAFGDTLSLTMSQYHPRAPILTAELLDEWSLAESLAFYRDRFADAGDFTFVFVGSFEPDALRPLVTRYLASLPTNGRKENWRDTGVRPPSGVIEKVVRRGIEPRSQTSIIFTGPFEYERANRHALAALADALEIELRDELREDLGGTYGVGVSQSSGRDPWPRYRFTIGFGSAPERLEELTRAVFAKIERVQTDGFAAATLDKVKETQRRSHETSLEQNGYWLGVLLSSAQSGEEPGAWLDFPALVDALTGEQLREAARKYLRKDNYVRVSLYPERGER